MGRFSVCPCNPEARMPTPAQQQPQGLTLMALDEFKTRVRAGESPERIELLKTVGFEYLGPVKAEGDATDSGRSIRIRITTGARDRDRDTIAPSGWKLDNYRRNPVVLYGHNYRGFPVARDEGITQDDKGLIGTPHFVEASVPIAGELAECTLQLIKGRYLNAASVGFLPSKYVINQDEMGFDFTEQELLEYSIVPVPANAEALVEARGAGIDVTPLGKWAEEVLDFTHGERGLWLPRAQAERVLKVATRERRVFAIHHDVPKELVEQLAAAYPEDEFKRVDAPPAPPAPEPAPAPKAVEDDTPDSLVFTLDEEDETKDGGAPDFVLELEMGDEPAVADLIELDADELRASIVGSVHETVSASLFTLTGRLS